MKLSKPSIFVIVLLTMRAGILSARPAQKVMEPERISYSHHLPRTVTQGLPPETRSRFWGTFQGGRYGVHLYQPKSQYTGTPGRYTFEVFRYSHGSFQSIRRVPFAYSDMSEHCTTFGISWMRLPPRQHRGLVFQMDIFTPKGTYGDIGSNIFVSFPQGLKSSASIQALAFGGWKASGVTGQENTLTMRPDGHPQIAVHLFPSTGDLTWKQIQELYDFVLIWDDQHQKFWPDAHSLKIIKSVPYVYQTFLTW